MHKNLTIFSKLVRLKLSLAVAFSAGIGYALYQPAQWSALFFVLLGVILLSGASSVLNQIQERKEDAKMLRTQYRPLPNGEISVQNAYVLFVVLLSIGAMLLLFVNSMAMTLGLFTIVLYNGVYTPLKKQTSLALFPGALVGALPPVIGWAGAGGNLSSPAIYMLAGFMFLWQMPHFFLLAIKYNSEYKRAGFKIAMSANTFHTKILLLLWVITTTVAALFFPFFGLVKSPFVIAAIVVINLLLIFIFVRLAFIHRHQPFRKKLQYYVSLYMVLILMLLIVDGFFY